MLYYATPDQTDRLAGDQRVALFDEISSRMSPRLTGVFAVTPLTKSMASNSFPFGIGFALCRQQPPAVKLYSRGKRPHRRGVTRLRIFRPSRAVCSVTFLPYRPQHQLQPAAYRAYYKSMQIHPFYSSVSPHRAWTRVLNFHAARRSARRFHSPA